MEGDCKFRGWLVIVYNVDNELTATHVSASLVAQVVKNLPVIRETHIQSLGQKDPLEKEMATHSIFLPGEFHGQRSLVDYSPWSCKESHLTERLNTFAFGGPVVKN